MPSGRVFFQGEALSTEVQRFVHHDDAAVPEAGIRKVSYRFQ